MGSMENTKFKIRIKVIKIIMIRYIISRMIPTITFLTSIKVSQENHIIQI